ncbi:Ig-like domain-containing protein [Paenibacillus sp. CC-CFT747]|nr:Ig-like domain-containing protein [Paenibacillus sp. CC-CFT747]
MSLQLVNNRTANAAGTEVTYTVSDPSVLRVDSDGKVTALKSGTAAISAAVKQDAVQQTTKSVTLTVKDIVPPVTTALLETDGAAPVNGWYTDPVTLRLTSEDNDSGVAYTEYLVNEGAWQRYASPVSFDKDGPYSVDFRSTDLAGNTETPKTIAFRIDQTAPTLNLKADPSVLWPADGRLVPVTVGIEASDAASGIASVTLISITAMEGGVPVTLTPEDVQQADIGTSDSEFLLAAKRSGTALDGRVYNIVYEAVDQAGNRVTSKVTITVPHDLRK